MYGIKNFEELTSKGCYFKLVTKNGKVIVKRNLLEILLKRDYSVKFAKLYDRIKDFKSDRNNYIELKICGALGYCSRSKNADGSIDLTIGNMDELICINIYECGIEDSSIGMNALKVINKKCIGKYILTQDGELVASGRGIPSDLTIDKLLNKIVTNIAAGKTDINVLSKLPLEKWNKDFERCGQNMTDFIVDLYSKIQTEEACKFDLKASRDTLLKIKDCDVERIKLLVDRRIKKDSNLENSNSL